jgi:hypothetical protein
VRPRAAQGKQRGAHFPENSERSDFQLKKLGPATPC